MSDSFRRRIVSDPDRAFLGLVTAIAIIGLAFWKAVEIVLWVFGHVNIEVTINGN